MKRIAMGRSPFVTVLLAIGLSGTVAESQERSDLVSAIARAAPPPTGFARTIYPPETLQDHVLFGLLAGAGTGLVFGMVSHELDDHRFQTYDNIIFAGFTIVGAGIGTVGGLLTGLARINNEC